MNPVTLRGLPHIHQALPHRSPNEILTWAARRYGRWKRGPKLQCGIHARS